MQFKNSIKILVIIFLSITFSCSVKSDRKCLNSYELTPFGDTINIIDCKGLKQGHWIISKPTITNNNVRVEMIKEEEGFFNNSKKIGFWKFFNTDGTISDSLEYQNNVPVQKKVRDLPR